MKSFLPSLEVSLVKLFSKNIEAYDPCVNLVCAIQFFALGFLKKIKKFSVCLKIKHFRASAHYALFGRSLVLLCFHVLLVIYYSRLILFLFFTQTPQLTKTRKHENTKLQPKSA
jgi:hypothetical protein